MHRYLSLATATALATAGLAPPAHAVHVSPDRTGQVLLFPYYTVRYAGGPVATTRSAAYDTLISIVNTARAAKVVRVRFLESLNGVEVHAFNLFLGPFDSWTGAVTRTGTGTADASFEGARLLSSDRSCTLPLRIFDSGASGPTAPNAFRIDRLVAENDGMGTLHDRTRVGFFEVIELGEIANPEWQGWLARDATGTPRRCAGFTEMSALEISAGLRPPAGGLAGRMDIINVAAGSAYTADATALDAWSSTEQYTSPDSPLPALNGGGGAAQLSCSTRSDVAIRDGRGDFGLVLVAT